MLKGLPKGRWTIRVDVTTNRRTLKLTRTYRTCTPKPTAPESPMIRITSIAVVGALLTSSAAAYAASGSVTDPKGDYPDIVKLGYVNAKSKVTMTMTLAGDHAQNESFYLRWGSKGTSYRSSAARRASHWTSARPTAAA